MIPRNRKAAVSETVFDAKQLLVLRKLTRAVVDAVRDDARDYVNTITPLLRPRVALGESADVATREPLQSADNTFRELQALYESVAAAEPFNLHKDLKVPHASLIIRKGHRQHMDSYSAFYEADGKTPTGLTGYLRDRGLTQVYLCGLATDFCVGWSAVDARKAGFGAAVIEDACRGIDVGGSLAKAWTDMQAAGVRRLQSSDLDV